MAKSQNAVQKTAFFFGERQILIKSYFGKN
jgi:hypothetical protein